MPDRDSYEGYGSDERDRGRGRERDRGWRPEDERRSWSDERGRGDYGRDAHQGGTYGQGGWRGAGQRSLHHEDQRYAHRDTGETYGQGRTYRDEMGREDFGQYGQSGAGGGYGSSRQFGRGGYGEGQGGAFGQGGFGQGGAFGAGGYGAYGQGTGHSQGRYREVSGREPGERQAYYGQGLAGRPHEPRHEPGRHEPPQPGGQHLGPHEPGYGQHEPQLGHGLGFSSSHADFEPDYLHWRNTQIQNFDREYLKWREERRSKFAKEFDEWRSSQRGRQAQPGAAAGHPAQHAQPQPSGQTIQPQSGQPAQNQAGQGPAGRPPEAPRRPMA